MTLRASTALILSVLLAGQVFAEGSVEAGKTKSVTCAACHGADGNSVNPQWPSLAGQHPDYIEEQLRAFKSGDRENPLMSSQAMMLDEQAIEDLAEYYSTQTPKGGEADPALVRSGERLYRGGHQERGVSACIACHGPRGRGNEPAGIPAIAGQKAGYTELALLAYASGERTSDLNQMMRNTAQRMTKDQIKAVASYLQGLR